MSRTAAATTACISPRPPGAGASCGPAVASRAAGAAPDGPAPLSCDVGRTEPGRATPSGPPRARRGAGGAPASVPLPTPPSGPAPGAASGPAGGSAGPRGTTAVPAGTMTIGPATEATTDWPPPAGTGRGGTVPGRVAVS